MASDTPIFIVTGTDTGIGKTVFAAALTGALRASYWKPIQAGLEGETDAQTVARLAEAGADRIEPAAYSLKRPASPHIAAAAGSVDIRQRALGLPVVKGPLVVEGAGGLMVPLSPRLLQIDLFAHWGRPVILVARTTLGTINHCLLSLEALRRRRVPVHGVAFVGDHEAEAEATISTMGRVRRLGRLPRLDAVTATALREAFAHNFDVRDFLE